MQKRRTTRRPRWGFTLIELMIVVAIIGILAAIAIPAFIGYIRKAKSAEATSNLENMYKLAAAYYQFGHAERGIDGRVRYHCVFGSASDSVEPSEDKEPWRVGDSDVGYDLSDPNGVKFNGLGFKVADYVHYHYSWTSHDGLVTCGNAAGTASHYTFMANGDLDGDGVLSTFELAVGSDEDNELYHARGFYVFNQTE